MKCPISVIQATFLYLDRMEKEGNLILKEEDIKGIIETIEKEFNGYLQSVARYEGKKDELPFPEMPQFHIISKHLVAGSNYVKNAGIVNVTDEDKIISVESSFDVVPDIEIFNVDNSVDTDLEQRVSESIFLKEDEQNIALFGTDSIDSGFQSVNITLNKYISAYLSDFHGNDYLLDDDEKKKLVNIIIGSSLKLAKNDYMFSNGNQLVDYRLVFDEKNIDNLIGAIKNDAEINNLVEREFIDIENLVGYIKEEVNKEYVNFLTSLPSARSLGHNRLIGLLANRYMTDENTQFMDGVSTAKTMQLEIKLTPKNNQLFTLFDVKRNKENNTKLVKIETNLKYLTDDLNEKKIKPVTPTEITIDLSNPKFKVYLDFNEEEVNFNRQCSERTDRGFFYHSNISDGRIQIEVIDESDTAPKGGGATVMRNIARNAKNIITGTGTGITGTAKSIVGQIANTGTIDNIEELERQYTELCGVFEIKSSYVRLLTTLVRSDNETSDYFKDAVMRVIDLLQNKDNSNLNSLIEDFTKEIIQKSARIGLNVEDINIFDAYRNSRTVLMSLAKDKKVLYSEASLSGVKLMEHCLFTANNTLVKEVSGIQAGILTSLINSQTDTNISITTRENLTGLKENMNFVDSKKYHDVSNSVYSRDGDITDILEKNNLSAKVVKEYLYKKAEKNYTSQLHVFLKTNFEFFIEAFKQKDKVGMNNLEMVANVANQSSGDFIFNTSSSGTSTKDDVLSLYSEYLSNNGNLSPKTTSSLSEESLEAFNASVKVFQKEFLEKRILGNSSASELDIEDKNIGDINTLSDELVMRDYKERDSVGSALDIEDWEMTVRNYDKNEFLSISGRLFGDDEAYIKSVLGLISNKFYEDNELDDEEDIKYEMNFYLPSELYNLYGDSVSIEVFADFKDAYPYKLEDGSKIPFSVPTAFMKKEWKEFISEPVQYKTALTNSELKDIIDNFSSLGKEDLLRESIAENKEKAVVVSSRRIASVFNLYDVVHSAKQRTDMSEPLLILPVSTPEIEEAVRNINKEFLKEYNMNIKTVKSEDVATEIDKANSKQLQYVLISNYTPIARGLSLAETDRTIVTNPITKKGDGIQLLARGINPSKNILDTNIHLHDNGMNVELSVKYGAKPEEISDFLNEVESCIEFKDGSLLISDSNSDLEAYGIHLANEDMCSLDRTYTGKINDELEEANRVYKGFTSGEYADTKQTMFSKPIVVTKPYSELLNDMSRDGELNIDSFNENNHVMSS